MSHRATLTVASRGSALARTQAELVAGSLRQHRIGVDIEYIESDADRAPAALIAELGTIGAFVRRVDTPVIAGELDAAVHSMKDMPTEMPEGLCVAAVLPRGPPGDVLVTPTGQPLDALPSGGVIGTGSLRRQAQVLAHSEGLTTEPIRGNVDTRVQKLIAPPLTAELERLDAADEDLQQWRENLSATDEAALARDPPERPFAGLVLAAAGLDRLEIRGQFGVVPLPRRRFIPAPAQGAICVMMRRDHPELSRVRRVLDHEPTRVATTIERQILAGIGGGCIAPIGVYARLQGSKAHVLVGVYDPAGQESVIDHRHLSLRRYPEAVDEFVDALVDQGARSLLQEASVEQ